MIKVEEHGIIGSNGKTILMDITAHEAQPNAPLLIFIHGFKGFKDWGAHHLTARFFAQNGYRYLKFNLSHSGVSLENPKDVTDLEAFAANTFSKELADIDLVINYAIENLKVSAVYLIGHSRGGGLSIITAANNIYVKGLITWSSIAAFNSLWKKEQEADWRNEGKIFVENARTKEKMPLNLTLLEDFEQNENEFDILAHAKKLTIPWLIVQGVNDVNVPVETAERLANANPASRLVRIEGANHVYGASHPYDSDTLPPQLFQVVEKSLKFLDTIA